MRFFLPLLLPCLVLAQDPDARFAEVDRILHERVANQHLAGGVVAIGLEGRQVHLAAYGKRDLESGDPMRTDTIFRIYSMTKGITSAAILLLSDEGKIGLEEPVATFIPAWKDLVLEDGSPPSTPMTVHHLLTHTSGLGYDGKVLDHEQPLQAMIDKLAKKPLHFEPGSDWLYGVSIDVLGHLVEQRSGQTLDAFLHERFFEPLGMVDTAFHVPPEKVDRYAAMYRRQKGKLVRDELSTPRTENPALLSGGGGLFSTAHDYLAFLQMIAHGGEWQGRRYLKPETAKRMVTRQSADAAGPVTFGKQERTGVHYGLGFNVRTAMSDWDPDGKVGEWGWGGMASTHYWGHPDRRLVVVTLEQVLPYSFGTEWAVKKAIYDAVRP